MHHLTMIQFRRIRISCNNFVFAFDKVRTMFAFYSILLALHLSFTHPNNFSTIQTCSKILSRSVLIYKQFDINLFCYRLSVSSQIFSVDIREYGSAQFRSSFFCLSTFEKQKKKNIPMGGDEHLFCCLFVNFKPYTIRSVHIG